MGEIASFLNCKIDQSKKVFRPRIETEFWVGKALNEIGNWKSALRGVHFMSREIGNLRVLDIFAGSGCIGIAILKNIKNSRVDFIDVSKRAVEQIKINLKLNNIEKERYRVSQSNLFEKVRNERYDFIFANPPYVALDRMSEVQKDVLEKEPKLALFAGRDGIFYIEKFLSQVKKYLKPKGMFFMEFDPLQKEKSERILKKNKFHFSFHKDQFKKYRWLKAWKKL